MPTPRPIVTSPSPALTGHWLLEPVWEESAQPDGVVCYGRSVDPVPFKIAVPAYIKCVDLDGDGRPELLRHGSFQRQEIFWQVNGGEIPGLNSSSAGTLFPYPLYFHQQWNGVRGYPSERRRALELVDWDGDGRLEAIIASIGARRDVESGDAAGLELYRIVREAGIFQAVSPCAIQTPDGPLRVGSDVCVRVADWDGDGRLELLFTCSNESFPPVPQLSVCRVLSTSPPMVSAPQAVWLGGKPLAAYADLHTCFDLVDWDGDGRVDVLFGSLADERVYFARNEGLTRFNSLASPQALRCVDGPLRLPEHGAYPCAVDWDGDGEIDLVASTRPGFIYFAKTLKRNDDGCPVLAPPRRISVPADAAAQAPVAVGFYVSAAIVDWDGNGAADLLIGCESGELIWVKNTSQRQGWEFAPPQPLFSADGTKIQLTDAADGIVDATAFGSRGAARFGYTAPTVCDLNGDGLADILTSCQLPWLYTIENTGTSSRPRFSAPRRVIAEGREYVSLCRVRPGVADFNGDGVPDLVHCDCSSFLTLRHGRRSTDGLTFGPARYLLDTDGKRIKLRPSMPEQDPSTYKPQWNESGRAGIHVVDWDGDGKLDILVGSVLWASMFDNCELIFLKNVGSNESPVFDVRRMLVDGRPFVQPQGDHDISVTAVDWNHDGILDLLIGTTDGWIYWYDGRRCSR